MGTKAKFQKSSVAVADVRRISLWGSGAALGPGGWLGLGGAGLGQAGAGAAPGPAWSGAGRAWLGSDLVGRVGLVPCCGALGCLRLRWLSKMVCEA